LEHPAINAAISSASLTLCGDVMSQSLHFVVVGILSASLGLAGGCGKGTPLAPTPPPPGPIPSTLLVTGWVGHTTFQPCRDCTVEVLDGPRAGRSVLTDANGGFTFSIAGGSAPTLRASKDGYRPATQVATPNGTGRARVVFVLESVQPPLDLAGTYKMTLEAGSHCEEVPAEIRRRDYVVSLSPRAEHPQTLFGARPVEGPFDEFSMVWGVSGNEVAVLSPAGDNQGPGIVERLENGTVELRIAAGLR
jgi:hypothetical protein